MDRAPLDLAALKGRAALLVFAPSERAPAYETQAGLLRDAADEFDTRSAVVGHLFASGRSRLGDDQIDDAVVVRLRMRFEVDDEDFLLVVIGRDGVERRRDDAPVQPEALFDSLDGRPTDGGQRGGDSAAA